MFWQDGFKQNTRVANPNSGYAFDKWDDGTTQNPRSVTVTENKTYVAYFKEGQQPGSSYTRVTFNGVSWNAANMGALGLEHEF